jgi:hypothetical protein
MAERQIDPRESEAIRNIAATIVTILLADCTCAGSEPTFSPSIMRVAMIATSICTTSSSTARG